MLPTKNSTTIRLQQQESRRVKYSGRLHNSAQRRNKKINWGKFLSGWWMLGLWPRCYQTHVLPLMFFICDTAIRRMVSLSGFRAKVEHVGTMSHNSLMYVVILFRLRRSISQCDSLAAAVLAQKESVRKFSHMRLCVTLRQQ